MSSRQQQIEAIGSTEAAESAAAAYAATLAARMQGTGVAAASPADGGGSSAKELPDAVSINPNGRPDSAAQMRAQARALRADAATARASSKAQSDEGQQTKTHGQQEVPRQQAKLAEANGQKLRAQNTAGDTGDVDRAARDASEEVRETENQASTARNVAAYRSQQGELLIEIGAARHDKTMMDEGATMVATAGQGAVNARLLYGRANNEQGDSNLATQRRESIHDEDSRILSNANIAVEAAQTGVASAQSEISRGDELIASSGRFDTQASQAETQAGALENNASLLSQANSIPFYVVGM